ncbi:MAG: serine aminopeptidase domain-containing protein [Longimicrobiales bacterium]
MNPLYFGRSEQPLFGVYHPPRTRDTRAHGIVLCYPFGQEYMRAHRAFRQLAILLSKAGFPVFRFDYYGTGDSSGASADGSLDRWIVDTSVAIDELKDNAGVQHLSLVGLRLGALLAARVATTRAEVTRVVLWDPVVMGVRYWGDLVGSTGQPGAILETAQSSAVVGINGFPWTRTLREAVTGVTAESYPVDARTRTALLVSQEHEDYTRLRDRYAGLNGSFTYRCIPSPGDWAFIDAYGSALLPQDIIQGIVAYLTQDAA